MMCARPPSCLAWLALLVAMTSPAAARSAGDLPDVPRLIKKLAGKAKKLQVDGKAKDWTEFPRLQSPGSNPKIPGFADIKAVAIAPTDTDLFIMIATRESPARVGIMYSIQIDVAPTPGFEFSISLGLESKSVLYVGGKPHDLPWVDVAIDSVVEARVPWASLPEPLREQARGPERRAWLRVHPAGFDPEWKKWIPAAMAIACYRLSDKDYALDPADEVEPASFGITMPVEKTWFIYAGSVEPSGADWLLFERHDEFGRNRPDPDSVALDSFACWGEPVFAPAAGSVHTAHGTTPDRPATPDTFVPGNGNINGAFLSLDGGVVHIGGFQKDSLQVTVGAQVEAGALLGNVGLTANSSVPALYVRFFQPDASGKATGTLRNVVVGLNPGADDPWRRHIDRWEPELGVYVGRAPEAQGKPK